MIDVARRRHPRWAELFQLFAMTGLLIGEALALRRRHVRLESGELTVEEQVQRRRIRDQQTGRSTYEQRIERLKSADSEGTIPIFPALRPVIEVLVQRARRDGDRLFAGPYGDYRGAGWAWERACIGAGYHDDGDKHRERLHGRVREAKANGDRQELRRLERLLRRRSRHRKRPRWSIHGLRHTMGVALGRARYSVLEIKAILGHAEVATSQRYLVGTVTTEPQSSP